LFGHAKGAFTGANQAAPGRIRSAEGGTLLLDEIAELPLILQPKLLRALETKQVDPVGATAPVPVDFRLVCATNQDLATAVQKRTFREDLFYRLNVIQLQVPALNERPEDVAELWKHFTKLHCTAELETDPELLTRLSTMLWPGNVRELKNLNQRLVLMRRGDRLTVADLEQIDSDSGGRIVSADSANATGYKSARYLRKDFRCLNWRRKSFSERWNCAKATKAKRQAILVFPGMFWSIGWKNLD